MTPDPNDSTNGHRMSAREWRTMMLDRVETLAREITSLRRQVYDDYVYIRSEVERLKVLEERRRGREDNATKALYMASIAAVGWFVSIVVAIMYLIFS